MTTKLYQDILNDIERLDSEEIYKLFNRLKSILHPGKPHISQFVGDVRESKFSTGILCPYCSGDKIVRNGKFKGRQRYLCRECSRTFNDFTNTPMQRTHLPDKWMPYLEWVIKGLSLRKAAEEIGVTHVTLFYWRHKILEALKNLDVDRFDGITEFDETYFLYSEKGRRNISDRKARHRGGKAKKRGISNEQVGVLVVCDRQKKHMVKVAGSGRINAATLATMVDGKLGENLILCSDADTAIKSFTKEHNIEHVELNANKKQRVKQGIYHIQNANSFHKRLKDWMSRFNGVATKYLDNYLSWFRFITMTMYEAMVAKQKQMLVKASQFKVNATCESLRVEQWCKA
ncbi:MAG TPA: IS1595 family transposase [Geobacteraceae bacterium]|nr:IS1595 family transposase [Geobacteraceae bacterium]